MSRITAFLAAAWKHKLLVIWVIGSALISAFLIFPFDDLSDFVTGEISRQTRGQLFLQMDGISLSFLSPGLKLRKVYAEGTTFSGVSANEVTISPSTAAIITQKPGGTLSISGIFKGDIDASLQSAGKTEAGAEKQKIVVHADKLELGDMQDFAQLPMAMKGKLQLSTTATIDPTLGEQPDAEISLAVDKLYVPTANVETFNGPIVIPELKLSHVQLKGRLSAGKFQFEDGTIGKDGDDLKGTVKGSIELSLKWMNGAMAPTMGNYDVSMNLTFKKGLLDQSALFLAIVDQYKMPTADGATYKFRMTGNGPLNPPAIGALQ